MKNNRNVLKAVAVAILGLTAGVAGATGSQDLTVTATISTICRFTTGSAIAVPFGTIDPSSTGPKNAAISVPYKCTKGTTAPGVSVTTATLEMSGTTTATNKLAFSIGTFTTATGAGFAAAAANATATATIAEAAYQAAPADSYTQTVTLSIDN
jgi:hypothetical protein